MTLPTKEKLQGDLETAYLDFTERATKAQISAAIKFLSNPKDGSARDALPGPVTKITLLDRHGYRTVLDLVNHTLESPPLQRTYEDGVDTTGEESSEILIDLSTLDMYSDDVIEFDPRPDVQPIMITFEGTPFPPVEEGSARERGDRFAANPSSNPPPEEIPPEEPPPEEPPPEEDDTLRETDETARDKASVDAR